MRTDARGNEARRETGRGARAWFRSVASAKGLVVAFLLAVFLTAVFAASDAFARRPVDLPYLFSLGVSCSALWILTAPLIWRFAGQVPPWPPRVAPVAIHIVASCLYSVAWVAVFALAMHAIHRVGIAPPLSYADAFAGAAYYFLLAEILFYAVVVVARGAFDLAGRLEQEATRRARVEQRLTRARLDVLRMQMRPHFLFNALHSVAGLVRTGESGTALNVLAKLGGVLRASLEEDEEPFAPVESELRTLEGYVDIERCRFGDRLDLVVSADPETLDRPLPRWLLQPLVENAIRHGIESSPDAEHVRLDISEGTGGEATGAGPGLRIVVEDDGPGADPVIREGLGLGNTRRRLDELFGDAYRMRIERLEPGTRVSIELPGER